MTTAPYEALLEQARHLPREQQRRLSDALRATNEQLPGGLELLHVRHFIEEQQSLLSRIDQFCTDLRAQADVGDAMQQLLAAFEEMRARTQEMITLLQDLSEALLAEAPPETASEAQWDRVFARSHDKHQQLAAKLRADLKAGRTEPLDPKRL
jgi:methyl-accepting chemotaxis protein